MLWLTILSLIKICLIEYLEGRFSCPPSYTWLRKATTHMFEVRKPLVVNLLDRVLFNKYDLVPSKPMKRFV
ncbi:hypothetical protein BGZ60DRAFT_415415 [Tricladium varicosporioides]|nr:hypothetical protein BGZ60DRAFT_415415 [Hymenoscyphus varicosporioides]